jgi:hypothetical protein
MKRIWQRERILGNTQPDKGLVSTNVEKNLTK